MIGGANQTRSYSHEQSNRYANGFLPIRGVGGEPPFPPAPYPRQQPSKNDSHLLSTHSSPYLVALSGKTMWNEMISRLHQISGERLVQIISFDLWLFDCSLRYVIWYHRTPYELPTTLFFQGEKFLKSSSWTCQNPSKRGDRLASYDLQFSFWFRLWVCI